MMRSRSTAAIAALLCLAQVSASAAEPGDIVLKRQGSGTNDVPVAVFPHWIHRMQFRCYACHDQLFQMKAGAAIVSMAAISDGKFCGACHDGKTAFSASSFDACNRCHRE